MSFFLNEERSAYRKWVNVVTSLLLPGSGHVLSGRKVAGVNWFLANIVVVFAAAILVILLWKDLALRAVLILVMRIGVRILTAIDSCKNPIPRLNFAKWVCVAAAIVFVPVLTLVTGWHVFLGSFHISSAAMQPTLMGDRRIPDGQIVKGDHVITERFTYLLHKPRRGDVAVYRTLAIKPEKRNMYRIPADEFYVKRIVGLPGERVSIKPDAIYINGQKLAEPKIFETLMAQTNLPPEMRGHETDVQLGADEYYMLGDNIANSLDSRYYGPIKGGYFRGKVFLISWPAERQGFVQ